MKNKRNIYVALTILIMLFGCNSTTKKSDSDVDRIQLMLLPEFMAMSMSQSGYIEILDNAKKDSILNTDAKFKPIFIEFSHMYSSNFSECKNRLTIAVVVPSTAVNLIPEESALKFTSERIFFNDSNSTRIAFV